MRITRKSIGIILLSLPLAASAQEKPEKHAITKIGVNYSADYTYRTITPKGPWFGDYLDFSYQNQSPTFGYHSGMTFLHQFKFGLILDGALQYSRYGHKNDETRIYDVNSMNTIGTANSSEYYDYLSFPFRVGYGLSVGKRITLSINSGISTNLFVANRTHYVNQYDNGQTVKGRITDINDPYLAKFRQFGFESVSSIGVDIRLNSAFSVKAEPTFRYFLTTLSSGHSSPQQRLYSCGINTTLFYTFHQKEKPKVGNMSLDF